MNISVAYVDICLPDYFGGDARPWVAIYPTDNGYTSRELREAILYEFEMGAVGGNDDVARDFIPDPEREKRSDLFFRKLPAALKREIKYRGKRHKVKDYLEKGMKFDPDFDQLPVMYVVFDIIEE